MRRSRRLAKGRRDNRAETAKVATIKAEMDKLEVSKPEMKKPEIEKPGGIAAAGPDPADPL
jgi:hypothetical protein